MAADTKTREADFASPFAATPEAIPNTFCDSDSQVVNETTGRVVGGVPALYAAEKAGKTLYFCAHHIRKYATKLRGDGFIITPDDIDYDYNPGKAQAASAKV